MINVLCFGSATKELLNGQWEQSRRTYIPFKFLLAASWLEIDIYIYNSLIFDRIREKVNEFSLYPSFPPLRCFIVYYVLSLEICERYSDVAAFYLRLGTGANKCMPSTINAR